MPNSHLHAEICLAWGFLGPVPIGTALGAHASCCVQKILFLCRHVPPLARMLLPAPLPQ